MPHYVRWDDLGRPSEAGEVFLEGIGTVEIEPDDIALAQSVSGQLEFPLVEMEPASDQGIKKSRLGRPAKPLE